uniref:Uncharacterized protein n=1 Tax=Anguilla anguilla TaxID=7936 RepID=A0A0E9RZ76_ANGAN
MHRMRKSHILMCRLPCVGSRMW